MTSPKDSPEDRERKRRGYIAGCIELPFRFEDLPPEFQALFSEVPPLPTYKIEDVKPWPKDGVKFTPIPTLSELRQELEDSHKFENEDLSLLGIPKEDIPDSVNRLNEALKKGLNE